MAGNSVEGNHLPIWLAPTLLTLFAILWGVWLLPHTIFIRHAAMVLGAILGLYVCVREYEFLFRKQSFSIFCIALLLAWVSFHLFFIGIDYDAQKKEYMSVWVKVILCTPFAIGMGIAVSQSKKANLCWAIFYIGLTLPLIVYFMKWLLTMNALSLGITNPHLLLNSDHTGSLFGVSRALYPFYCLPSFMVGLFLLIKMQQPFTGISLLYLASIILTPLLFFLEGDRTGLLLAGLSFLTATAMYFYSLKKRRNRWSIIFSFFLILILSATGFGFVKRFDQIHSVIATTKLALDIDSTEEWKYQGQRGVPLNEVGKVVDISNYYRITWALAGARILKDNPMGYGLLTLSFDHLSKQKWPGSRLGLTHSGWLDFSLGYGLIGGLLLLGASASVWLSGFYFSDQWRITILWGFGSLNVVFLLKEISYDIVVNAFIFLMLFIAALYTASKSNQTQSKELV